MNIFDFSWMLGHKVEAVRLSESCQWDFMLSTNSGIGAECPWRLLQDGKVEISSEDHRQQYGLPAPLDAGDVATRLLATHHIKQVDVRDGTADLIIEFSGGLRLEIIPFSSGYESWGVTNPSGAYVFAQGGGQLSGFSAGA